MDDDVPFHMKKFLDKVEFLKSELKQRHFKCCSQFGSDVEEPAFDDDKTFTILSFKIKKSHDQMMVIHKEGVGVWVNYFSLHFLH